MKDEKLYEKFSSDKRIYNLNQGYWKRKLESKLNIKISKSDNLLPNTDAKGIKIYDANPIFFYINESEKRAFRIIQDSFEDVEDKDLEDDEFPFISAWFDKFELYNDNNSIEVKELVIALFLNKKTVEKSVTIIKLWLSNQLNKTNLKKIINE